MFQLIAQIEAQVIILFSLLDSPDVPFWKLTDYGVLGVYSAILWIFINRLLKRNDASNEKFISFLSEELQKERERCDKENQDRLVYLQTMSKITETLEKISKDKETSV